MKSAGSRSLLRRPIRIIVDLLQTTCQLRSASICSRVWTNTWYDAFEPGTISSANVTRVYDMEERLAVIPEIDLDVSAFFYLLSKRVFEVQVMVSVDLIGETRDDGQGLPHRRCHKDAATVQYSPRHSGSPYIPISRRWCTESLAHLTSCVNLRCFGLPMRN